MAHEKNGVAKLGEISTIRDILMGQQMSEYEKRFQQLEAYLQEAEQALKNKIDNLSGSSSTQLGQLEEQTQERFSQLEQHINQQFGALEQNTNNRFAQLEKLLSEHVEQLQHDIKYVSKRDRQRIGNLLLGIGNQLMEE